MRKPPGKYKTMNDSLVAAIAYCENATEHVDLLGNTEDNEQEFLNDILPDFALIASHPSDPTTLNEAL